MIILNLVLLNEIKQINSETNYKFGKKKCDNETFLEEGFICCKFTVCDQFCYKNECVPKNKIWFCTQIGVFWSFTIKHFCSFICMIFSVLMRIYYKSSNQISYLKNMYICVLLLDLSLWSYFYGLFCIDFMVWVLIWLIMLIFMVYFLVQIYIILIPFTFMNLYEPKDQPRLSLRLRKISITLYNFMFLCTYFILNSIIIVDFFMYIMSNNYRKSCKKYIEEKQKGKKNR